jgi:hypothetical protein
LVDLSKANANELMIQVVTSNNKSKFSTITGNTICTALASPPDFRFFTAYNSIENPPESLFILA